MEFRKRFDKSYVLDERSLKKIIDICKDVVDFNEKESMDKYMSENPSIGVSINFKDGLSLSNISLEEAQKHFNDDFSDIIDSVFFTVGHYSDCMQYVIEFDKYGIVIIIQSENLSKLTQIKSDTMNLCENIKSSLTYRFLGFEKFVFVPIFYISLGLVFRVSLSLFDLTNVQVIFSCIIYISIVVSTFFSNVLFPKSRILFGKNAVVEKKWGKSV